MACATEDAASAQPASAEASSIAPPLDAPLAPGARLGERYLLLRALGTGGTAVVYEARDLQADPTQIPDGRVAIKTPRAPLAEPSRAAARLKHEFERASRLDHPSIVRVLQLHEDERQCFMVMELIAGRLLSELIREWTLLTPPSMRRILHGCAEALAHAHERGVVHGDFKPGNVFVMQDDRVKVVDFGAAATTLGEERSRIAAGTPAYASPQVLSGQLPDPRDDVFSFACVAYELLTGQHPFERRSSLQARDEGLLPPRAWNLSAQQWLVLLSALSFERAQRPADISSLLAALLPQAPASPQEAFPQIAAGSASADGAGTELAPELMPRQGSWGFFIFVACALAVTFIAGQSQRSRDAPPTDVAASLAPHPSQDALASAAASLDSAAAAAPGVEVPRAEVPAAAAADAMPGSAALATHPSPTASARNERASAAVSEISFDSRTIVTSESSVAAVFIIKRSQPLSSRARVQWRAISGSAEAGIDFASRAEGSVEFAVGQAQRAIYVPLRNDLLQEDDETFTIRLHSPNQARLGEISSAVATILDDD